MERDRPVGKPNAHVGDAYARIGGLSYATATRPFGPPPGKAPKPPVDDGSGDKRIGARMGNLSDSERSAGHCQSGEHNYVVVAFDNGTVLATEDGTRIVLFVCSKCAKEHVVNLTALGLPLIKWG